MSVAMVKMLVLGSDWQEENKTSWQREEAREAGTSRRSAREDLVLVTGGRRLDGMDFIVALLSAALCSQMSVCMCCLR